MYKDASSCSRWEHRGPQPDLKQSVRDLGILSPKWDVSIKFLPSELREPQGRGDRKSVRARGTEDTKKEGPSKSTEQSLYELTETKAAHTGPT